MDNLRSVHLNAAAAERHAAFDAMTEEVLASALDRLWMSNAMTPDTVLQWLKDHGSPQVRAGMARYGIPNDRAFGVAMGEMKRYAKTLGRRHDLALGLWPTGWYEARTIAGFVAEPVETSEGLMDAWCADFDTWAICDTVCFHLFDKTLHAWTKVHAWARDEREFVRRAAYALIWSLSVHDKTSSDDVFMDALALIETAPADDRPLVKKGMDMALRAVGKRNAAPNTHAVRTATAMAASDQAATAWIGRHALTELSSNQVRARLTEMRQAVTLSYPPSANSIRQNPWPKGSRRRASAPNGCCVIGPWRVAPAFSA